MSQPDADTVPISCLRVGVIGGSVAGSVTAAELVRLGADVMVFERSRHLEDRGAGIGLALSLVEALKERGLIDADMAHIPVFNRRFVVRCDEEDPYLGRTIWVQSFASASTNWDVLYGQIRRRVPDAVFHQGCNVVAIRNQVEDEVSLELADGRVLGFDLVVCADGYDSLGRRILFPGHEPRYVGYIIWRGLIPEGLVGDITPFEGVRVFAMYEGGHAIFYLVPGRNGELKVGRRRLNWGIYDRVTDEDLERILTDAEGTVHRGSLPPGAASGTQVSYVHNLARTYFPRFAAQVVCATDKPFVQSIYDGRVPAYHRGRICLIGDASTLVRPHTAAGSVKAMTDALALSKALATRASLDASLQAWDDERCAAGNQLVSLGQALGEALVTRVPDWSAVNPLMMERLYAGVLDGKSWYEIDEIPKSA
jgi:2-polyprenyl-6-methoxyphenol hydroxylase-like FAD-dependent oxidoreductase